MKLQQASIDVLTVLMTRRQGLSINSIAPLIDIPRTNVSQRLRTLRAYGAVEPVPGSLTAQESLWAITAHGKWMLETGSAITSDQRPVDADPGITPSRAYCNTSQTRTLSSADLGGSPMRPGSEDALRHPSRMGDRLHYRDGSVGAA